MKSLRHILLGAVIATLLFCSLGFYDSDTFDDSTLQYFGSGRDVSLQFDGTNFELFAVNAADIPWAIGGTTYGFDLTYYFETAGNIAFDYDDDSVTFSDEVVLVFGTGGDFSVFSDTANILEFDPGTAGNEIRFGTAFGDAVDITWYGDLTGDTVAFDEENCEVLFTDIDLQLDDAAILIFGTGDDFTMYSDTADTLEIDPGAAGDTLKLGTSDTDSLNVIWYADVSGDIITFDEENVQLDLLDVDLNMQGGAKVEGALYHVSRKTENHSANHTLTSPTDIGTLITADTAAVEIKLPGVAAGATWTVMNIGADGTEIHVDPDNADLIAGGCGFAAALDDGDKLTNTAATAHYGDYVTLSYFDATGWYITDMVGTWADGS